MKALRIKDDQEEKIRQLAVAANKKLIQLGREPLRDSERGQMLLKENLKRA